MTTTYPSISEYLETFQHLPFVVSDPAIKTAEVDTNTMGTPILLSGNFAVTAGATLPSGKRCALRCFHKHVPDAESKYNLISKCLDKLKTVSPNYFVNFQFQNQGIKIKNEQYPLIKMEWVEGKTLGSFIEGCLDNPNRLQYLLYEFKNLYKFLKDHKISHGDIQNGNVIITDAGIKLVDYDGMFVPGMKAGKGAEVGHPHFQHPQRKEKHFGPTIDEFSFMVVHLSLLALIKDSSLKTCFNQENIIFTRDDFLDPENSSVFNQIRRIPDLQQLADSLTNICLAPYEKIPTFNDFLQGKKIPKATLKPVKTNTFTPTKPTIQTPPPVQPAPQPKQQHQPPQQTRGLSSNYPFRSSTSTPKRNDSGIILAFFSFIAKFIILTILSIGILLVLHILNTSLPKTASDSNSNTNTPFSIMDSIKAPEIFKNNTTSPLANHNINENIATYTAVISDVSDFVNLRSTPTIRMDNVVDKVYSGDTVYIANLESNGWYKVITNNNEGYIYAGLLQNNTYPDAVPIAILNDDNIKAIDREGNDYDIIKSLVIDYQDEYYYYLKTEKGNLIQISKEYISIENPYNINIPYIDNKTKNNIEYIAKPVSTGTTNNVSLPVQPVPLDYNLPEDYEQNSNEISHIDGNKRYTDYEKDYNPQILQNYYAKLSNAIYSKWKQPYISGQKTIEIKFKITSNGYFTDIQITKSSGLRQVDESIIQALKTTQPFEPPPKEYNGDYVNLPVTITGY